MVFQLPGVSGQSFFQVSAASGHLIHYGKCTSIIHMYIGVAGGQLFPVGHGK